MITDNILKNLRANNYFGLMPSSYIESIFPTAIFKRCEYPHRHHFYLVSLILKNYHYLVLRSPGIPDKLRKDDNVPMMSRRKSFFAGHIVKLLFEELTSWSRLSALEPRRAVKARLSLTVSDFSALTVHPYFGPSLAERFDLSVSSL